MAYNLRTLFLALAEDKDLRLTAFRCKTSQRMIVASIAQLEAEHGTQLCIVEKHRVSLTEAGERLCRTIMSGSTKGNVGRLLAMMQDSILEHAVPRWMSRVADRSWPFLQIGSSKGNVAEQMDSLLSGAIDIVLVYGWPRVDRGRLRVEHLYGQHLAAFLVERGHAPGLESISLASMRHAKAVVPSSAVMPGIDELLSWESRKAGSSPSIISSYSKSHFFDEVRSGHSVGIAPSKLFLGLPRGIAMVPLKPTITIPFSCLHRTDVSSSSIRDLLKMTCDLADAERKKASKRAIKKAIKKVDKPSSEAFKEILNSFMVPNRT